MEGLKQITIGTAAGQPLTVDILKLVDTRLLVQANSGGGKSGTLRLIAERATQSIQTIILDNEGEFATLREKVDVLIVGDGGELPADPRSAGLLARRLVETKISAVVDLYELPLDDRRAFVARFLTELIGLPRHLWRPTLVMLDEAHLYAPQGGDVESTSAVVALQSQGRKRGYCGILATQRLSKLHKDAAAECNNVLIGRTWLDNDQQRAGDVLGMSKADRARLRDLQTREFFGFGPAFSVTGVFRMRTDDVATTMPKAGHRFEVAVPPPSSKVKALLAEEMANLAEEADREIRDLEEAQEEIARLRRELADSGAGIDNEALAAAERAAERRGRVAIMAEIGTFMPGILRMANDLRRELDRIPAVADVAPTRMEEPAVQPPTRQAAPRRPEPRVSGNGRDKAPTTGGVSGPQQRMLDTLLALDRLGLSPAPRSNVAALTNQSPRSSGWEKNLSTLRSKGLITYPSAETLALTEEGRARAQRTVNITSLSQLHDAWKRYVSGPQERMLDHLIRRYPKPMNRAELAAATNQSATSSGWEKNLSTLRSLKLIDYPSSTEAVATPLLFPRGLR